MKNTPDYISSLKAGEVFVFGSNERGIHGAGAARIAYEKFGAIYGQGFGLQGNSFAIPTKDDDIKSLPLESIKNYISCFVDYTQRHPELTFLVTKIGCGLAGFTVSQIASLFETDASGVVLRGDVRYGLSNCIFPKEFDDFFDSSLNSSYGPDADLIAAD